MYSVLCILHSVLVADPVWIRSRPGGRDFVTGGGPSKRDMRRTWDRSAPEPASGSGARAAAAYAATLTTLDVCTTYLA